MNKSLNYFILTCVLFVGIVSCKPKVPPVSERIAKTWKAQLVKHGNTIVYSRGGATNASPGYDNYSLNLVSSPNATLRDVDGTTFSGTYALSANADQLTLSSLSPEPSGSNGSLTYTIQSINNEGTEMVLVGTAYAKTGGTANTYTLTTL